jgi:hypothetical protein
MARYIVTVEYDAGQYWIHFPGIDKAGSHAKRVEDIDRVIKRGWRRAAGLRPVFQESACVWDDRERMAGQLAEIRTASR